MSNANPKRAGTNWQAFWRTYEQPCESLSRRSWSSEARPGRLHERFERMPRWEIEQRREYALRAGDIASALYLDELWKNRQAEMVTFVRALFGGAP